MPSKQPNKPIVDDVEPGTVFGDTSPYFNPTSRFVCPEHCGKDYTGVKMRNHLVNAHGWTWWDDKNVQKPSLPQQVVGDEGELRKLLELVRCGGYNDCLFAHDIGEHNRLQLYMDVDVATEQLLILIAAANKKAALEAQKRILEKLHRTNGADLPKRHYDNVTDEVIDDMLDTVEAELAVLTNVKESEKL